MSTDRLRIVDGVTLRPARAADKPDVEALCAQIWEGGDYIPEVWDEWLADPEGQLSVAEVGGRVGGLGKLTLLAPGEWWLEGLRVDPAYRGRGLASRLHEYHCDLVDRIGQGVLRLATNSANVNVHHLCRRTGFAQVGNYILMKADAAPADQTAGLTPLGPEDVDDATKLLPDLPLLQATGGLYEDFWTWLKLTPNTVRRFAAEGKAYGWRPGGELRGLALIAVADEERLAMGFADSTAGDWTDLAMGLRGLAAAQGAAVVSWKAVDDPGLLEALGAAGYVSSHDLSFFLFERPVPLRH